jgi:hypothetical protein
VDAGALKWAITTPIISDQVSIPDGVVGDVVGMVLLPSRAPARGYPLNSNPYIPNSKPFI